MLGYRFEMRHSFSASFASSISLTLLSIALAAPVALRAQSGIVSGGPSSSQSASRSGSQASPLLTGQAAFTDWNQQQPGVRHKITLADLPEPKPDESVQNQPQVIERPADAWPIAPAGFKVTLYAGGDTTPMQRADNVEHMARSGGTFTEPRLIRVAPNGDLFLSDSGAGEVIVLRGVGPDGKAAQIATFATGLDHPFGIAFYPADSPKYVYVANTTNVVRFPYHSGDLHATGPVETIVPQLAGWAQLTGGGHWTRDIVFTKDGTHMLVSVGSGSNVDDADIHPREFHRADVLEYTPEGKFVEVYAHGIRNCVGEAINPTTGSLWCSTNERDALGNHLVPDYVTSVPEGGFFGWPWYYMGGHEDPRLPQPCANGTGPNPQLTAPLTEEQAANCKRVDLSSQVLTPDVLVQPHMASLEETFYPTGSVASSLKAPFPATYDGDAFVAEHGSWNRANRAGYEVIVIPMHDGHATGEYDDFLTGFVTSDGQVWGRPVGVAVAADGSLFVTDDGSRSVWHVTYTTQNTPSARDAMPAPLPRRGGVDYGGAPSPGGKTLGAGAQILSDTQGVDFTAYLRRIIADTKRNWDPLIPKEVQAPLLKEGIVGIRFSILPSGQIGSMTLETPSGDQALDKAAWYAITSEGQFPPLPKEFHGPQLELRFGFFYNLQPTQ